MTAVQTIQLRLSFCRENLNRLLSIETRSAEQQTELETLTAEVSKREPELRAALAAEPDPRETRVEGDAETRELRQLTERANVGDILIATFEKRQTIGAPAELQKHYGIGSHQIPLEMLRVNRGVEERAAATVPANIGDASQAAVITPVFSSGDGAFLGIERPDRPSRRRGLSGAVHTAIREGTVHRFDRSGPDRRHVCRQQLVTRTDAGEFQLQAHRRGTLREP